MGAALTNLGYVRSSLGDPDSAEVLFRRSVDLRRRLGDPVGLANGLEALGGLLARGGSLDAADSAIDEALQIRRRVLPEGHALIAGLVYLQGNILLRKGRALDAEQAFREALRVRIAALGTGHFVVAFSRNGLATALEAQGRLAEAETLYREAWQGYVDRFGPEHLNAAAVEANLAGLLFRMGSPEAELRLAHSVRITRSAQPANRGYLALQASLGVLRCRTGKGEEAVRDLREAVAGLAPGDSGQARDDYLRALNELGTCLTKLGARQAARDALTTLLQASASRPEDDPYRAVALRALARLAPP
jgi:tetratricopeptide (TPR) repeat protein